MAIFEKDFNTKMEQLGYGLTYYGKSDDPLEDESPETTSIYVGIHVLNGSFKDYGNKPNMEAETIFKSFPVPKKKLITPEYLIEKLNKENVFTNFSKDFKKLLNEAGYTNGISVYPTSYGIGVFIIFTQGLDKIKNDIESILNKYNIEFTNEYSDARYVYRYKISKKAENINKLKTITNET